MHGIITHSVTVDLDMVLQKRDADVEMKNINILVIVPGIDWAMTILDVKAVVMVDIANIIVVDVVVVTTIYHSINLITVALKRDIKVLCR